MNTSWRHAVLRSVGIDCESLLTDSVVVEGDRTPRVIGAKVNANRLRGLPSLIFDPVGRIGGQPFARIEADHESPVIGTGMDWPPAAGFLNGDGSLRAPLPLVLAHLVSEKPDTTGPDTSESTVSRWHTSDRTKSTGVPLSDVVGWYCARAVDRVRASSEDDAARVIMSVPNATPLRAMTHILRASDSKIRLIWRPVATLIHAIHEHADVFSSFSGEDQVLVLHFGTDGYEATLLNVIEHKLDRGPKMMVPGRPRFTPGFNNVSSPLAGLLRHMSSRLGSAGTLMDGEAWARCWVSMVSPEGDSAQSTIGPWSNFGSAARTGAWRWFVENVKSDCRAAYRNAALQFRTDCEAMLQRVHAVRAVVISGELSHGVTELAEVIVRSARSRTPVMNMDGGPRCGAALFGWREARQWPTYLDHLPQMRLFVEDAGEPTWREIVESDWVDAGMKRTESLQGFKLKRIAFGETQHHVELAVTLEGDPDVRETNEVVALPAAFAHEDIPLTITVEVQAATGEPRVTATPRDISGAAGITLDWSIATSTKMSAEQYLASRPRAFPGEERLVAASWWYRPTQNKTIWFGARQLPLRDFITAVLDHGKRNQVALEHLQDIRKLVIQRKWHTDEGVWRCVVNSDGSVQVHEDVMDRLRNWLWDFLQGSTTATVGRRDAMKVLSWTRFYNMDFETMIVNGISSDGDAVHASGNGVRTPKGCQRVIKHFTAVIDERVRFVQHGGALSNVNNPLKQLAWLLALNPLATSALTESEAMRLTHVVFKCANALRRDRNFKVMFRWSIRCMALSLSRRKFSSEFLDPKSEMAMEMLRFSAEIYTSMVGMDAFIGALIEECGLGSVSSFGVIQSQPAVARDLKQFMEYLNRRGTGSIIVEDGDGDGDGD